MIAGSRIETRALRTVVFAGTCSLAVVAGAGRGQLPNRRAAINNVADAFSAINPFRRVLNLARGGHGRALQQSGGGSSSGITTSGIDMCMSEADACTADASSGGCLDCLVGVESNACAVAGGYCSDVMDYYCCSFGDSCGRNAQLVAFIDCVMEQSGCSVAQDLCDPEDDNGGWVNPVDMVCPDEFGACTTDGDCAACLDAAVADEGSCESTDASDCDGAHKLACCYSGLREGCRDNALFFDYFNCAMDIEACTVAGGSCDGMADDDGGSGFDDSLEICVEELADCQANETCAACYSGEYGTSDFDSCDSYLATDCAGLAQVYCCVAGDVCREDALLLRYINCAMGYGELSCTFTDLCDGGGSQDALPTQGPTSDFGGGIDPGMTSWSPTSSPTSAPTGFDTPCLAQQAACAADEACLGCLVGARLDGSCEPDAGGAIVDCAGIADYFCCVAGEACSNNSLVLDYVNCGIELESCELTELCV